VAVPVWRIAGQDFGSTGVGEAPDEGRLQYHLDQTSMVRGQHTQGLGQLVCVAMRKNACTLALKIKTKKTQRDQHLAVF
jgi:hypothetical protein